MHKSISDRSALLFVVLAPLLWAGNFIVGRALHGTIEPFDLNYLRWFVAAITLLPVIILNWRDILLSYKRHMPELIVLASFGIVLFNWLLYVGLKQTPASVSGLIFGLSPIIILIIARIWRGRRLDLLEIVGGLVAFGGVGMVLFTYADMTSGFSLLTGPIFVLFAALAWALFTVCLNRLRLPLAPTPCMAAVVWCGLCLMTPLAVWRGNLTVPNVLVPENQTVPSDLTTTSLGEFNRLPPKLSAITVIEPSGSVRVTRRFCPGISLPAGNLQGIFSYWRSLSCL